MRSLMRALFLLLLLVNLGIFAWYRWYTPAGPAAGKPAGPPGGEPLQLLSELTPEQRKALANPPAVVPATTAVAAPNAVTSGTATAYVAPVCASYGPFPSDSALQEGQSRLKQLGIASTTRLVPGTVKLGYWVYLPPFGSRKEADAALNLLKKRGVKDLYVVTDEANRNAISLGVYSQHDGALERQKNLRKLGFKATVAERFRDEPRYWLDARTAAGGTLPAADMFKDLAEDGTGIVRATELCPST